MNGGRKIKDKGTVLKAYYDKKLVEVGCDEAGRGCLAGPVFAAAVILPKDFYHPLLNDSKQISEKSRLLLRPIIEAEAIAFGVTKLSPKKIDQINILNASILAMHLSIDKMNTKPELILVDGNRFKPYPFVQHLCIIKGDSKFASIAAASVLAKTYRDDYMLKLHKKFDYYGWDSNKGYPTKKHRAAIAEHGPCKHHRMTFRLLKEEN